MSGVFSVSNLINKIRDDHRHHEFIRVPGMSAGIYVLPVGHTDQQTPHKEDELYYVIRGQAKMVIAAEKHPVGAGDAIFVEAGLEHRFVEYRTRTGAPCNVCARREPLVSEVQLRSMVSNDWPEVRRIYLEGIATGNATFETEAPSWEKWDGGHIHDCRLIAHDGPNILGWAALSPVSSRCVYAGVAEVSVYVGENVRGKGVGRKLLAVLIEASERCGIWTLQPGIFPENIASIKLHKSLGFRELGRRERLGKMAERWRDVVLLERRSAVAGV